MHVELIPQKTNLPIVSSGSYKIIVLAFDNSTLYDVNFALPNSIAFTADFNWFDSNGNQIFVPEESAVQVINDFNFSIPIPYFLNARVIQIKDSNNVIKLEIPVKTQLNYHIGYGGAIVSNSNYKVNYSLVPQPTADKIFSTNYVCRLGPID